MMTAEHRGPLAAFLLVFAAACLIVGNGVRTHVVDVLISAGAPREVLIAIAPDMVLGNTLITAPPAPQATQLPQATQARPDAAGEAPATSERQVTLQPEIAPESGNTSVRPTPGDGATRPATSRPQAVTVLPAAGPTAPVQVATPIPTPNPKPEPNALPVSRAGLLPTSVKSASVKSASVKSPPLVPLSGRSMFDGGENQGSRGHSNPNRDRDADRGDRNPGDHSRGADRQHDASSWGHARSDHDLGDRADDVRGAAGSQGQVRGNSHRNEARGHQVRKVDRHDQRAHSSRDKDRSDQGGRGHSGRGR